MQWLKHIWHRLWFGWYDDEKKIDLAHADSNLAQHLLRNDKYNKNIKKETLAEIILIHINNPSFTQNLRNNLDKGLQPLRSIAKDLSAVRKLFYNSKVAEVFTEEELVDIYIEHFEYLTRPSWQEIEPIICRKPALRDRLFEAATGKVGVAEQILHSEAVLQQVTPRQMATWVVAHHNNNNFMGFINQIFWQIKKYIYRDIAKSVDSALGYMALANKESADILTGNKEAFPKYTDIDIARLIAEYGVNYVAEKLQHTKPSKSLHSVALSLYSTAISAETQDPDAAYLLTTIKDLYATLESDKQMITLLKRVDSLPADAIPSETKAAIYHLAISDTNLAKLLVKNIKLKQLLDQDELVNLICKHGTTEAFCREFIPEIEKNFGRLAVLTANNYDYAQKLFSAPKPVFTYIQAKDRYTIALRYGSDFTVNYLPQILFDVQQNQGYLTDPSFANEVAHSNEKLFSMLSNEQLFQCILANTGDTVFLKNLNFNLNKAGKPLARLLKADKNFATKIYQLGNVDLFNMVTPTKRIKIAESHGEDFLIAHQKILLDAALEDVDAAKMLFASYPFRDQVKKTLQAANQYPEAAMTMCKDLARIMSLHQGQSGFTEANVYIELYTAIRNYLTEQILSSTDAMKKIFAEPDFNLFFSASDKLVLESKYKAEIFNAADPVEFQRNRFDTLSQQLAKQAMAKEQLANLVQEAKLNQVVARNVLADAYITKQLGILDKLEILANHAQDEFFYRDLTAGNLIPVPQGDQQFNLYDLALEGGFDAFRFILGDDKLKNLLTISQIQQLFAHYEKLLQIGTDYESYYTALQLKPGATVKEIKQAYYKFNQKYHLDKTTGLDEANEEENKHNLTVIREAYDQLCPKVECLESLAALKEAVNLTTSTASEGKEQGNNNRQQMESNGAVMLNQNNTTANEILKGKHEKSSAQILPIFSKIFHATKNATSSDRVIQQRSSIQSSFTSSGPRF